MIPQMEQTFVWLLSNLPAILITLTSINMCWATYSLVGYVAMIGYANTYQIQRRSDDIVQILFTLVALVVLALYLLCESIVPDNIRDAFTVINVFISTYLFYTSWVLYSWVATRTTLTP